MEDIWTKEKMYVFKKLNKFSVQHTQYYNGDTRVWNLQQKKKEKKTSNFKKGWYLTGGT